jgi:hypothetical protein
MRVYVARGKGREASDVSATRRCQAQRNPAPTFRCIGCRRCVDRVDSEGIIRFVSVNDLSAGRSVDEVLRVSMR